MTELPAAPARVLLVEDEALVAMLIEDMLADFECEVAASAGELTAAIECARAQTFDFAVIDVNLRGTLAYPVARVLRERRIPFVFVTGYGAAGMDPTFDEVPVLQKPFRSDDLARVIRGFRGLPIA